MVVKNKQTQKLPHGANVQNGGGVKATFGQCPEERGFFSDVFSKHREGLLPTFRTWGMATALDSGLQVLVLPEQILLY